MALLSFGRAGGAAPLGGAQLAESGKGKLGAVTLADCGKGRAGSFRNEYNDLGTVELQDFERYR